MCALNEFYWRFRRLLEHKYGLNPKEDALISFLTDKKIDFTPLFYNSAIPIKELFYFFIIAGNSFYNFNRIPSLFEELEKNNVLTIENKKEYDLQKLRRTIRNKSLRSGVLIRTVDKENSEQWAYIKAQDTQFSIINSSKSKSLMSAVRLRKIYAGEFVELLLMSDDVPKSKVLLSRRLFKPEQFIPFYFVESDFGSVEDLHLKLRNMFYAYKITRNRMMRYYSCFIDTEFMRDSLKRIGDLIEILNHIKEGSAEKNKCFALLRELNQIDVFMMSQLKEKMGEIR